MSFPVLPPLCLQNSGIHFRLIQKLYNALFCGSLLFGSPSAGCSLSCFVCILSFSAFLFCPRGYSLCAPTPTSTDRILQSPPPGCSSTKEKSQKRHLQLCVELFSLHKTVPAPGDLCLECKVCCCHLHADTIITCWLRKDWKPGCFYGLQDLHINIIHFNSTITLEVMPGVKRENEFLAGLQTSLFSVSMGWSRDQGSTAASGFHRWREFTL